MLELIIISLATFIAGMVQTITGFGAGIISMLIIPYVISLTEASGINGVVFTFLNISLVVYYWKYINFKKIVFPSIISIVFSTIAVKMVSILPLATLKLAFSIFIVLLAIYFNFFNKIQIKGNALTMIICSVIAGLGNGLFAIAGPTMVLYYLAICKRKEEYIGTINTFFLVSGLYASIVRLCSGIITKELVLPIILGTFSVLIGKQLGTKIVDKISIEKMKKIIYLFLAFVGIIQLIQCL